MDTVRLGDKVVLFGVDKRCWMIGEITSVTASTVTVTPDAYALRVWYPNGYLLGKAHWHSRLQEA
jgi:hypothetical protein